MLFQRTLLAFDGTEGAQQALEKTKELAHLIPSMNVHLVYVNEQPKVVMGETYVVKPDPEESDLNQEVLDQLQAARIELEPLISCSTEVLIGDQPEKEIIKKAEELNCDLIIIGSRGLGGFKKLILGSVSTDVVNHASIPVLVVK